MNIDKNEYRKKLYTDKNDAVFSHYCKGYLYYNVTIDFIEYQFPISVVDCNTEKLEFPTMVGPISKDVEIMKLSSDLGDTKFDNTIPAKLLWRYIDKAITSGDFIQISLDSGL
jgi:hypothetical protein